MKTPKGMTYDELAKATGVGPRMLRKRVARDGIKVGSQMRGAKNGANSVQSVAIVPMSYCRKLIKFYGEARRLAAS